MPIIKRRNIEKVVNDNDLDKYLKQGYVVLGNANQKKDDDSPKELNDLRVSELKEIAKNLKIAGYSNLNQKELIAVIEMKKAENDK